MPPEPSVTPQALAILVSALSMGVEAEEAMGSGARCPAPGGTSLLEFCELLATEPKEEELHQLLAGEPGYLMGLFGTRDQGDLAFLSKPRVGNKYVADFAIVQVFQGGATIFLVEIETSHESLFTRKLGPARRLQSALTQVQEWREWIQPNKQTFVRETIDQACGCRLFGARGSGASVRFDSPSRIRKVWDGFGGNDDPNIHYAVIAGRWSVLTELERKRFLSSAGTIEDLSVYTYEQLMRQANYRPDRWE